MKRRKKIKKSGVNLVVLDARRRQSRAGASKPKTVKPATVFLYALGIAALGGGGYLIYDRMRRKTTVYTGASDEADTIIINNNLPASTTASKTGASSNDNFPLKKGSRGNRVVQLQQALANVLGISVMNANGGIDGIFGSGTANALKLAGYSEVIDQATFNRIVGSAGVSITFNAASIADSLYKASSDRNVDSVLTALKQMKTTSDYAAVNSYYKEKGFISRTIVTDLLDYAFSGNEPAKEQVRNEFLRMGLKVSSSGTWSLQGLRLYNDLVTLRSTVVTDSQNNRIPVNKNTILGDEIKVANGKTWFRSIDNSILSVPTQDVKHT